MNGLAEFKANQLFASLLSLYAHRGLLSMGGRVTFPLYSIYHSSKWAVEGFSESLHYELKPFNIKVKLIEPGAIKTEFYGSNRRSVIAEAPPTYKKFVDTVEEISQKAGNSGVSPEVVAKVIFWQPAIISRSTRSQSPTLKPKALVKQGKTFGQ
jgi:short-subunit dehydrogenase